MEIIEVEAINLAILVLKKLKLEKKLKKTLRCIILKCFKCIGFKSIEEELHEINTQIKNLSIPKATFLTRTTSL